MFWNDKAANNVVLNALPKQTYQIITRFQYRKTNNGKMETELSRKFIFVGNI